MLLFLLPASPRWCLVVRLGSPAVPSAVCGGQSLVAVSPNAYSDLYTYSLNRSAPCMTIAHIKEVHSLKSRLAGWLSVYTGYF
ncbi:UNVERIFIED_CONTAM: hypothetical protein FKN15_039767 [Acipenser sinensis]